MVMEDLTGLTPKEVEEKLKAQNLTARFIGTGETVTGQIPAAGQIVSGGSEVLLYLGEEPEKKTVTVPDFTGMNRQQTSDQAAKLGLNILVAGKQEISPSITVTAQSIAPETEVSTGTTITLTFTDTAAAD